MFKIFLFILSVYLGVTSFAEVLDKDLLGPIKGDVIIGDPNAPNTIIAYSSLSCPLCAHFHKNLFPEIEKKYLKTKKAKFIFRYFAIKPVDLKAGALLVCVPDDKKHIFIDVLFLTQKNWAIETTKPEEALESIGRLGGLDGNLISKCLRDKGIEDSLNNIRDNALNLLSINSAPTFLINGKKIVGVIDSKFIEKELT